MTQKILVMTQEIESASHRGIYLYTKTMFATLKRLGFETALFTQSPAPRHAAALRAQVVFSLARPQPFAWHAARAHFMSSDYRGRASEVANDVPLPATEWKWQFLSNVDYFLNSPGFFAALDFEHRCADIAPNDLLGRLAIAYRRARGEFHDGALDVDFVADSGYDVVLATSPVPIRSRSGRVKIIQTVHDLIPLDYPFIVDPGEFHRRLAISLDHATQVISVSDHTTRSLTRMHPESRGKVTTLYQSNPIDHLRTDADRSDLVARPMFERYGIEAGRYFVYVGAIERRKNIRTLIEAFSILDKKYGMKLVLAGPTEPDYAAALGFPARDAPAKLAGDAVYLGIVSEAEKVALLSRAAALLFPAVAEGFGLPVIEAMSVGCPVVTTRCTAMAEIGGDAVWYLENPGDAVELSSLMARLLEADDERAGLKARGLRRAADFSLAAYVERVRHWARATGAFDASSARVLDARRAPACLEPEPLRE